MKCRWCGSEDAEDLECDYCWCDRYNDPAAWLANTKFVSEERRAEAVALAAKTKPLLGFVPNVNW